MAESEERPWRVGGVANLDLSICNINIYSELQTLTSTYETLPSQTSTWLTLLVNPLRTPLVATLFSIKYYKKSLCSLK